MKKKLIFLFLIVASVVPLFATEVTDSLTFSVGIGAATINYGDSSAHWNPHNAWQKEYDFLIEDKVNFWFGQKIKNTDIQVNEVQNQSKQNNTYGSSSYRDRRTSLTTNRNQNRSSNSNRNRSGRTPLPVARQPITNSKLIYNFGLQLGIGFGIFTTSLMPWASVPMSFGIANRLYFANRTELDLNALFRVLLNFASGTGPQFPMMARFECVRLYPHKKMQLGWFVALDAGTSIMGNVGFECRW